jgi:two-component system chemotaxis response regulator CheB
MSATINPPIQVMLVDDSAVVRGLLTRALEADPNVRVVATVADGQMALNALQRHQVEVAVLDIEMPNMDGLTALPKLIALDPSLQVIMASTLTKKNADVSLRALQMGAKDYLAKPTTTTALTAADDFKRELIEKVKALGLSRRQSKGVPSGAAAAAAAATARAAAPAATIAKRPVTLRPATLVEAPEVIAIGSSTGGPQALFKLFGELTQGVTQPILVTQHMPPTFTTILAEHIAKASGRVCAEARDGEPVVRKRVYVAPGDHHMLVDVAAGGEKVIKLTKDPPENFCRPAVDPMFRSLARAYGRRVLGVILTGMGSDGLKGGQVLVQGGATLIAQDEASSVVWGMPGAVAQAGICSAVLPLGDIAQHVSKIAMRSAA